MTGMLSAEAGAEATSPAAGDAWLRGLLPVGGALLISALASGYGAGVARHHLESAWAWYVAGLLLLGLLRQAAPEPLSRPVGAREARLAAGAFVLMLCLTWMLYAPTLGLGLLSDDFVLLERARTGRFFARQPGDRPLPVFLLRLLDEARLAAPPLLHALNLLLHGLNGLLVLLLARRLGARPGRAVAASALFLTFPASVEPVAWIAGQQDLLVACACLAFAELSARGARLPALAVLALGLATKESAMAAPVLGLVVGASDAHRGRTVALACGMVALFAVWRVLGVGLEPALHVTSSRYLLKELISRPIAALAAPWAECLAQAPLWTTLSIACETWMLAAHATEWGRGSAASARLMRGTLWIWIAIAPSYAYFYVGPELRNGRYLYLAAAGWAIVVTELLDALARRVSPSLAVASLALIVGAYSVATRDALGHWREAARLRDAVLASPSPTRDAIPRWHCSAPVFVNGYDEARARR